MVSVGKVSLECVDKLCLLGDMISAGGGAAVCTVAKQFGMTGRNLEICFLS